MDLPPQPPCLIPPPPCLILPLSHPTAALPAECCILCWQPFYDSGTDWNQIRLLLSSLGMPYTHSIL